MGNRQGFAERKLCPLTTLNHFAEDTAEQMEIIYELDPPDLCIPAVHDIL